MEDTAVILQARWVVPVSSEPIENGRVVIEQSRIVEVGRASNKSSAAIDLGDVALLPGLVNAHTHLELTSCSGKFAAQSFVDWIQQVSRNQPDDSTIRQSIRDGMQASIACGVTTIGDIGHGFSAVQEWLTSPVNMVGFLEVLGMGHKRNDPHSRSLENATEMCERFAAMPSALARHKSIVQLGITPHAPYSTDPSLYRQAIDFAQKTSRPICTHLAETREELQFLADGTGPFRDLLERFNLWDGSFQPPGCSPVEYAQSLGLLACKPLLAHVNYVGDEDLDRLAQNGCSVAYCPRTHAFFKHEPHRYRDMLARKINVCLGTDSLASNPTLSILDELRFIRMQDHAIDNVELLKMATLSGARALGLDRETGSLQPGKRADLIAVPLSHLATTDPIEDICSSDMQPSAVYVAARRIHPV